MSNFEIGGGEAPNGQIGDHGLMIVNQAGDSALVAAIRRERGRVADPAAAERFTLALQAELAAAHPDTAAVRDLIDRISATAGTAPEVAAELSVVRRLLDDTR
ncbi:hypothetical protein ACQP00_45655 [Dactylosporangium sp. CS-047395]|uniref:hypothetical protein n=1 Tax=Dactylosporangium sp. CS-047395 TaxID=3239936 RepID=UPI003D92633A